MIIITIIPIVTIFVNIIIVNITIVIMIVIIDLLFSSFRYNKSENRVEFCSQFYSHSLDYAPYAPVPTSINLCRVGNILQQLSKITPWTDKIGCTTVGEVDPLEAANEARKSLGQKWL